jgi:hypothetical protein
VEGVDLARVALKRLGLIDKGIERDRRPTTAELGRLFRCFDENARLTIPMTRSVTLQAEPWVGALTSRSGEVISHGEGRA